MKQLARDIARNLKKMFGRDKLTPEEMLKNVLNSDKQQRLLEDIKAIRRSGNYSPDYNKPKKFTEYQLGLVENGIAKVISSDTFVKCERPEDFIGLDGSLVNGTSRWISAVRVSAEKDMEKRKLAKAQQIQHEAVKEYFYSSLMNKFSRIN